MELEVNQRHLWIKWMAGVIIFLIFIFVTEVPLVFAEDSSLTGRAAPSAENPVPTIPANPPESLPGQSPQPQSESVAVSDLQSDSKSLSVPTPSKIPPPPAGNPAAVLIPVMASVATASAAAIPIVDNLFTAVSMAAPVAETLPSEEAEAEASIPPAES